MSPQLSSKLPAPNGGNFGFLRQHDCKSESNEFAASIPSKGVQVWWFSFHRLQIQLWLHIACYVTSLASIVKQYTHVRRFRVVLIKGNTRLRSLKKNCSFVFNSIGCGGVVIIAFTLVALLFAVVTRWKRWWRMMAALLTMAANLILARTRDMTWSQTLQTSSFYHQHFLTLNKILNLFTRGRIMQFPAINTSRNILPAILLGKQRACGRNWRFSSRRLAVVFTCFYLLAGFSCFNFFFLNR